MQKWIKRSRWLLAGLAASALLTGCGPSVPMEFGIPKSQFEHLTPAQKRNVIDAYNRKKEEDAKMQSFWNLLGAAGSMVHVHKTLSSSSSTSCSGNSCTTESSGSSFSIN
jgi:hypothetical protein